MRDWVLAASALALTAAITGGARASDDTSPAVLLRSAFGGAALETVGRFDYELTVESAAGKVERKARYALAPASGFLHVRDILAPAQPQVWSTPEETWRRVGDQVEFLGAALAQPYRDHVAYHFLPMLRSSQTRYERTARNVIRVAPSGVDAFDVLIDPASGRILENRFGDGVVGRELDYRRIDGVWWPMQFEIVSNGQKQRQGRFSEVRIQQDSALPPFIVSSVERSIPAAHDGVARLVGAGWMSTPKNEYNLSIDAAQRTLVFARSEADFEHAHIWIAQGERERWTAPAQVSFSDPRYSDSDPWLAPDGKTLYFISNRPVSGDAPRKDLDLWRAVRTADGDFAAPQRLSALNSDAHELGPEVHDGWIYFNSSRKGGPAHLSIYRARLRGNSFDVPEPLPAPFNEGEAQGDFTLSPDGRLAMFWSQREGSEDADLFVARRQGKGWSKAIRLPAPINAVGFDFTPSFSADGRELRFSSMRKPAWLHNAGHVLNGQANVYIVPGSMIEAATRD